MPGAGAVVQGRQTLGMADESEGGGGFAPVGVTNRLGVVGRGAVDGRERQRDLSRSTAWVDQSRRSLAELYAAGGLGEGGAALGEGVAGGLPAVAGLAPVHVPLLAVACSEDRAGCSSGEGHNRSVTAGTLPYTDASTTSSEPLTCPQASPSPPLTRVDWLVGKAIGRGGCAHDGRWRAHVGREQRGWGPAMRPSSTTPLLRQPASTQQHARAPSQRRRPPPPPPPSLTSLPAEVLGVAMQVQRLLPLRRRCGVGKVGSWAGGSGGLGDVEAEGRWTGGIAPLWAPAQPVPTGPPLTPLSSASQPARSMPPTPSQRRRPATHPDLPASPPRLLKYSASPCRSSACCRCSAAAGWERWGARAGGSGGLGDVEAEGRWTGGIAPLWAPAQPVPPGVPSERRAAVQCRGVGGVGGQAPPAGCRPPGRKMRRRRHGGGTAAALHTHKCTPAHIAASPPCLLKYSGSPCRSSACCRCAAAPAGWERWGAWVGGSGRPGDVEAEGRRMGGIAPLWAPAKPVPPGVLSERRAAVQCRGVGGVGGQAPPAGCRPPGRKMRRRHGGLCPPWPSPLPYRTCRTRRHASARHGDKPRPHVKAPVQGGGAAGVNDRLLGSGNQHLHLRAVAANAVGRHRRQHKGAGYEVGPVHHLDRCLVRQHRPQQVDARLLLALQAAVRACQQLSLVLAQPH